MLSCKCVCVCVCVRVCVNEQLERKNVRLDFKTRGSRQETLRLTLSPPARDVQPPVSRRESHASADDTFLLPFKLYYDLILLTFMATSFLPAAVPALSVPLPTAATRGRQWTFPQPEPRLHCDQNKRSTSSSRMPCVCVCLFGEYAYLRSRPGLVLVG